MSEFLGSVSSASVPRSPRLHHHPSPVWRLLDSRRLPVVLFCFFMSALLPRVALGQDTEPGPEKPYDRELSKEQIAELKTWLKEDAKYLKWYKAYGNQVRVKLRHRPEPPDWLSAECVDLIGGDGPLVSACNLFHEIHEGELLTNTRQTVQTQRAHKEALVKSKWYERVHLGVAWPIIGDLTKPNYGAIVATHISVINVGRVEINLPGLMFLSVPDLKGRRVIRQATHFGISLKLNTFTFPGTKQKYVSHLNLANALVMDGFSQFADRDPLSLVGLSFTVKK